MLFGFSYSHFFIWIHFFCCHSRQYVVNYGFYFPYLSENIVWLKIFSKIPYLLAGSLDNFLNLQRPSCSVRKKKELFQGVNIFYFWKITSRRCDSGFFWAHVLTEFHQKDQDDESSFNNDHRQPLCVTSIRRWYKHFMWYRSSAKK